jgi:ADP-glucose pyrophosphorylase
LGEGSIVSSNVTLDSCILGPGVVIEKGANIQNKRLQSTADGKGYPKTIYLN